MCCWVVETIELAKPEAILETNAVERDNPQSYKPKTTGTVYRYGVKIKLNLIIPQF
jgi:hypothetical protein